MGLRDDHQQASDTQGWKRLEQIALATMAALEQAGLTDVRLELNGRVFERDPTDLHEVHDLGPGVAIVEFKPFVELLLLDIQATARHEILPAEAKRARIRWTMEMAGF